jgi:CelD/BcsL family acetyltransferase involved in cellulose biosynthesis
MSQRGLALGQAAASERPNAAVLASLPATAQITIVNSLPSLLALEAKWRGLEKTNRVPVTVFQSFDWISAWCSTYCVGDQPANLQTIAGYDDDRLVFILPLALEKRSGINVLHWLTDPFGQYGDILCAVDQCPRKWFAAARSLLHNLKGLDIMWLRHVREDSVLWSHCAEDFKNARHDERAPFLDLTLYSSEAQYDERYSGTQRKRRKKIRKHLEELGPVTFTQLPLGILTDRAIEHAMAEKNAWLTERGLINRVINCPGHVEFLKRLSRLKPQGMEMVVTEMKAGDRPVSWEVAFRVNGTHYTYLTSHENALTDLSPGRLHFDQSQRACLKAGVARYDLMVPHDQHKESWSSGAMPTHDLYHPLSAKGALAGRLYLQGLRPALRALYYRLPSSVLRIINPATG